MEGEELEQRRSNKIYLKLATQLSNSKFENHDLMKILHDGEMIKKFRDFTNSIAGFDEFDHDKVSFTAMVGNGVEFPAVKIPFKKPLDEKTLKRLNYDINWIYKEHLNKESKKELILDEKGLTLFFNENPANQLSDYHKVLTFAKTSLLYKKDKERSV